MGLLWVMFVAPLLQICPPLAVVLLAWLA